MKKQVTDSETIFQKHISAKGLVTRKYIKNTTINNNKTTQF